MKVVIDNKTKNIKARTVSELLDKLDLTNMNAVGVKGKEILVPNDVLKESDRPEVLKVRSGG